EPVLVRQLDAEADGDAARLPGTPVAGLHDPGATPGDDRVAHLDHALGDLHRAAVVRAVLAQPGGAEDRDGRPQLGARPEPLDELGLDAHRPPRVGVEPVRRAVLLQQALVGGAVGALRAAQRDRTLAVAVSFLRRHGSSVALRGSGTGAAPRERVRGPGPARA